jgi:hypothetical protein
LTDAPVVPGPTVRIAHNHLVESVLVADITAAGALVSAHRQIHERFSQVVTRETACMLRIN